MCVYICNYIYVVSSQPEKIPSATKTFFLDVVLVTDLGAAAAVLESTRCLGHDLLAKNRKISGTLGFKSMNSCEQKTSKNHMKHHKLCSTTWPSSHPEFTVHHMTGERMQGHLLCTLDRPLGAP